MIFRENRLLSDEQQTILMKYHTLFFRKLRKTSKKISSAAVLIGILWDKHGVHWIKSGHISE